jgi:hypothetical protein
MFACNRITPLVEVFACFVDALAMLGIVHPTRLFAKFSIILPTHARNLINGDEAAGAQACSKDFNGGYQCPIK